MRRALILSLVGLLSVAGLHADQIASADLQIQGAGLKVITISATTGIDIPAAIQTEFGGKQNEQAQTVEGLLAVGELSGPGLETPIRLETAPGHKFQIPGLSREGVYFLQNIRLMKGADFLQSATPSVATITVSNLLQTTVRVKQLTPEEIRARGITIDARNYDVFEYTFSFLVNNQIVEIPFPVIVDPRTHEVRYPEKEVEYDLPPIQKVLPPRWQPPPLQPFALVPDDEGAGPQEAPTTEGGGGGISIPAAIVIPNSMAVLHQFFAVTLMVTNGAPAGTNVVLDSVTAQIKPPQALRTVKSIPAVAFNQPVPIVDATTGVTFLVAQAKGEAEWAMEGLQPGTHTVEVEVRATYKSPGQADFPLKGKVRASVVVHDPRFNITFSHPDTVRKDIDYSTYSFITNMSGATQNIRVNNGVPACAESPGANVCRVDGTPAFHDLSIGPGEMKSVEYKLKPGITGKVFATAGSVSDDNLTAAVQLHMGVSESGIPLSPATLVMPYYASFLKQSMVGANLQLLGLGYSLATAPLTPALANHPNVIKTDVFQRATDIARAGQRVYLHESMRDSLSHMTLDLLGNALELQEWDELRRREKSGRSGAASVADELETSLAGAPLSEFVSRFATVTAWRAPYLLAVSDGPKLAVRHVASNARMDVASEETSGWVRQLPFGEVNKFLSGELAIVGRWSGQYEVTVTPSVDGPFTLHVILPAATDGSLLRAQIEATGTAGKKLTLLVDRGASTLELRDSLGGIAVPQVPTTAVSPQPLEIIKARQDLNLSPGGHKMSVLWNRPVKVADGVDLLTKFSAQVILNKDNVTFTGPRPISAAALQDGARVANLTFDHALSSNADYSLQVGTLVDPLTGAPVSFPSAITPVIDNDRPAGIIYGRVLKGDNTPIANAEVRLSLDKAGPPQYDLSRASDGAFLFEYVPRNIDLGLTGAYGLEAVTTDLKSTKVDGAVRLPGKVHVVNLVFLGRGSAEGYVRYNNGEPVPNAKVVVGSTMFNQLRETTADASGRYSVADLPVGPLTFSATDLDGNVTFAASEVKTPGQVVVQDLSIFRRPFPGTGTIRGIVRRSDTNAAVPFAQMGVYSQGYGLMEGFADSAGRFEFKKVPVGFITVLAAEWNVSRESAAVDFDLGVNEVRDVTLTLNVKNDPLVVIEGNVLRENPLFPGDTTKYEKVAGAVVKIETAQATTADAVGHYTFPAVPVSFKNKKITAYDPITKRTTEVTIGDLDTTQPNPIHFLIRTSDGYGKGSIRVRLLNAAGYPVPGYRVINPRQYPIGPLTIPERGNGIYQVDDIPVGGSMVIWAIGNGSTPYGHQFVNGTGKVEFNGHVAALTLRLPGQGTVRVKLTGDIDVIGPVNLSYPVWDEADQALGTRNDVQSSGQNGLADYATFTGVPALQNYTASSSHPVYGYSAQSGKIGFDGEVQSFTLQLNKLVIVRGVVYAIDGRTPVPGAAVRIEDGAQNQGIHTTLSDGSFEFRNVKGGVGIRVLADVTQEGIYRTGVAFGSTPPNGGVVSDLNVILRTQGSIDGKIVYAGYKVFDPQNPANNRIDDTPNDLSDNAPVPLAQFILRELDYPYRAFGTAGDPSTTDIAGRFTINNVFTGPLRITASDPLNQETRGAWTGAISQEGQQITALIGIGVEGFGPVVVRVLDPNAGNAPVLNADVTLYRNSQIFDLASTDANGSVTFDQVPANGTYKIGAFSKGLGKSGASDNFTVPAITGIQRDIILEFSGRVDGTLSDPEAGNRGVPGAPVTLSAQGYQTRDSTDVDGKFELLGVREGTFKLDAKDTLSNRRATATRTLTQADPNPFVALQLEPTETLHLNVYLPNDAGGNSNILASVINIDVTQRYNDFMRSAQGNQFRMAGLFRSDPYHIKLKELGGAAREMTIVNSFPKGSFADQLNVVLPAFGSVEVRVLQGTTPYPNARVVVSGGSKSITVFTDANGVALANGIPLGPASVQVTSLDTNLSGSGSVTVASQSTPAAVTITLASFAGITGLVEAETGGPSVGTRVVALFGNVLEMMTDGNGRYTFNGIPTGRRVNLTYMGPDDVTVGARGFVDLVPADAGTIRPLPTVKLDATPPQVVSIFPADGSANVSPDTSARVVFSEPMASGYINSTYLQLLPADSATPVAVTYTTANTANGTFTVTMTPPAPPAGQQFPLKSNTLYRIVVSGEMRDLTDKKLPAPRGASFITSDYAEPKVMKVIPSTTSALQPATTFEFRFNEPIDPAAWQPNGGGQFHFYKVTAPNPSGTVIAEKPGRAFMDPATTLSLFFSPNDPIEQESFYRVVFSGVRDMQNNVLGTQTFHFFSYDLVPPFATIISPVPDTYPLISGVEYTVRAEVRNANAGGPLATDVAKVDYFRVDGSNVTYIMTATAAPWQYKFVAFDAPPEGAQLTLRAVATDLSGNESAPATFTWQVKPNRPPQNVTVNMSPATSIYPGNRAFAAITFEDEGTFASIQLDVTALRSDNTEYKLTPSPVKTLTRSAVNQPWPSAIFEVDLPANLKQGTKVTFAAKVTDVRGLPGNGSAQLDLLVDSTPPVILTLTPASGTTYKKDDKYQIVATVRDAETGPAEVTFAFDGRAITVTRPSAQVTPAGEFTWRFSSGDITVPPKNVDTTIGITATTKDYSNNATSRNTEVIYTGVNDPDIPKGAWLCPIDKAVYPAGESIAVKLQVRAVDDIAVTAVKFTVPGVPTPIAATRVGTSDVYEATATISMPAAGESVALSATISDASANHDITLPITLSTVTANKTVTGTQAVLASNVAEFTDVNVVVRGTLGKLVPHVPLRVKNLIVLDGGRVETLSTTTTVEHKLDLTVTENSFIDCASSIDVSGRGYLGGWADSPDGSGKNNDQRGRTVGNTVTGGASTFASASHGGVGGERSTGVTNAIYGSVTDPTELGAGGGGGTNSGNAGASGGGAIKLSGGLFAVAGFIRADGGSRFNDGNPGAGGSININSAQFFTGPAARITANGGDDDADAAASRGAGGGRIAIKTAERFEVEELGVQVQARGGRNGGTGNEGASHLDGGAGTIYVRRPGQTDGELFSGSFDERFAATNHLTRPTPLSGLLQFDKLTVGQRALVRADAPLLINGVLDNKTAAIIQTGGLLILNGEVPLLQATTSPTPTSSLIQAATLNVNYTATSAAGIGSVKLAFSPVTPDRVDPYAAHPTTATASNVPLTVPATATVGPATLTLSATDRAGRSVAMAPQTYDIIANTPPVIDQFDVAPLSVYPGKIVTSTIAAHDDLKVTRLTLNRTIGATPQPPSVLNLNSQSIQQTFNDTIPITTPGGQTLTLELLIEDGFPGRSGTSQTRTVQILRDTVAPAVTITNPLNDALFQESAGATIPVRATITDADVGVKEAFVQLGTDPPLPMSKSGNEWTIPLPVPPVEGTDIVTKTLTVTGKDYEGNAGTQTINIRIQPLNDPNAPVVSWVCTTSGAMYPAGYSARLRVFAIGNNAGNQANAIQKVEIFVGDSTTPLLATAISGNQYEVVHPIPTDAVTGSVTQVRAVATNVSGLTETATSNFTIVTGTKFTVDKTISATDLSFENQTIIVQGGTTTVIGAHTFDKLIVLDGAKVTHLATDANTVQRLTVTGTSNVFVSCTGSIDVSARGVTGNSSGTAFTYDRATDKPTLTGGATNFSSGSHGGAGGVWQTGNVPAAYGSPFDPNTPGGAGASNLSTTCSPCRTGGGVIRLRTARLQVDGKVLANGESTSGAGAGGSIRIDASTITGGGEIRAEGGQNFNGSSGGGGRIALYYEALSIPATKISAASLGGNTAANTGAPGTIYLRQVNDSGAKVSDELIVDNTATTNAATVIGNVGTGSVSSVNGAIVTLSAAVPFDIEGTWIEFLNAAGAVTSAYEITARTPTTVTVRLASGESAANVTTGSAYRGAVRLDRMTSRGTAIFESDVVSASTFTGAGTGLFRFNTVNAVGDVAMKTATMEVNGSLGAPNLSLVGSTLRHSRTTGTTIHRLNVNVAGTMSIDATSAIDVSARGITGMTNGTAFTYDRATDKPTLTGGSSNFSGGSHGGRGGLWSGNVAAPYGSIFDPNTPGGAGAGNTSTTCSPCRTGGGVARVKAATIQLDGKILANGELASGPGAGGSIRLDAGVITGAGEIHADGGSELNGASGGGGRIAIYYKSLSIPAAKITAASLQSNNVNTAGAPGTIYLRQVDDNGNKVTDEIASDNLGRATNITTVVITAGSGTVTAVNGAEVTLSAPVPFDVEGTWIEFLDATGNVASSYEIVARTATSVTLRLGSGDTAPNVAAGAAYRGAVKVGRATSRGLAILDVTGLNVGTLTTAGGGLIRFNDLNTAGAVTLQGATVEANGTINASSLSLLQSSTLTHSRANATTVNRLNINLTGTLTIDSTSSIDVSMRGLTGSVNGVAYTYDRVTGKPTLTGGATVFSSGSHGGQGGQWTGNVPAAYGSVFDPNEPGGAGAGNSGVNCMPCRSGGGVVRIKAAAVQIDGKILANGEAESSAGAGGSILIDAASIAGAGEIHADGGQVLNGASGGGGRIALYFTTLAIPQTKITAVALQSNNVNSAGAAGTVFLKSSSQLWGDLIVDNLTRVTNRTTLLTGVGYATATAFTADSVTAGDASFHAPDQLRGVRLVANYDRTKTWPIVSNDNKTLRLGVGSDAFVVAAGQPLRGLYQFNTLKLRNAKLDTIDLLEVTAPVDKDAASTITGNNQLRPVANASLITLEQTPTGAAVLGAVGAVSDLDTPLVAVVRNTVSGSVFQTNVNTNGSFSVGVAGNAGDLITFKAVDSNAYPLESPEINVGTLPSTTPVPGQINKSEWTTDASFFARTLSRDRTHLVISSLAASPTLVVLNVADAAHPSLFRAVNLGIGAIRDAVVFNGWAYVAANRFGTISVTDQAAPLNVTGDPGGEETGVAVTAGYAFTAETGNYHNDGRIHIYDISTPAAPRWIRDAALFPGSGVHFTDLIPLGTDYLIALTPDKTGTVEHDVVIIDRRDLNAMRVMKEVVIPSFDAFRGVVSGTKLYVGSTGGAQFVAIDVSNPNAPVILGSAITPSPARGMAVSGPDAFAAVGAQGLLTLDVSNAVPLVTGSTSVGGTAHDATLVGSYVYVANDIGVALLPVNAAPQIVLSHIDVTQNGSLATVTGAPLSIGGSMPITVEVADTASSASMGGFVVQPNGSFTASLPVRPGDPLTIKATDRFNRSTGPLSLGRAPFGSQSTLVPVTAAMSDANFLARNVATGGNHLVLGGYPSSSNGDSDKLVIFDVTNRSNPVYRRFVQTGAGNVRELAISNGYLFVAANRLLSLNLSDPASTPVYTGDPGGEETGLEIVGNLAFTAETGNYHNDGRIHIYDISVPSAPRWILDAALLPGTGVHYTDLAALGTDYLVAVTPDKNGSTEHDVVIIDRRDLYAMKKVVEVPITSFEPSRVEVIGSTIFVTGDRSMTLIDASNPADPEPIGTIQTPGYPRALDALGTILAVADGSAGVTFMDHSSSAVPVVLGNQFVGGNAWDVAFNGSTLYVANEQGVAVIDGLGTPPLIDRLLIEMTTNGASTATVTGLAKAVLGLGPLTVEVRNVTTSTSVGSVPVAADGSFSTPVNALPGHQIAITAKDRLDRITGPVSLGSVPFGTQTKHVTIDAAMSDTSFMARNIGADDNDLVVTDYANSDKILLFDVSTPGNAVFKRKVQTGAGGVRDLAVKDGWAFIAANRFLTLNLSNPAATPIYTGDPGGEETGLAIADGFAFTAETGNYHNDGRIHVYDIAVPSAPLWILDAALMPGSGVHFTGLAPMGSDYLIAVTPDKNGAIEHDVVVIDRRDPNAMRIVKEVPITAFEPFRVETIGRKAIVSGTGGGIAVVDLTNPLLPVVERVTTLGGARGTDASGATLVVADGGKGVAFVETSAAIPSLLGWHQVPGSAFDVVLSRGAMYVASDVGVTAVSNVTVPPMIDGSLLTVTPSSANATITGAPQAITGVAPITARIINDVTGATSPPTTVIANGSFSTTVAAVPGQSLTVSATDAGGRTATRKLDGTFGTTTTQVANHAVAGHTEFRARRVVSDGTSSLVTTGIRLTVNPLSNRMLLFRQPSASEPAPVQVITATNFETRDTDISSSYVSIAGRSFATFDFANPTGTTNANADPGGEEGAVAVSGQYAFTTEIGNYHNDGRIHVYNLANPAAPVHLGSHGVTPGSGLHFTGLVPIGVSYLAALSWERPGNADRDITIVERININGLVRKAELPIPAFDPQDGVVDGTWLYVAGGDAGVAIIDVSNPLDIANPVDKKLKSIIDTPGIARAVAVSGPNEIVVADGPWLTFINVADKTAPFIIGRQEVSGNAMDVHVIGRTIRVASENQFHTILRPSP